MSNNKPTEDPRFFLTETIFTLDGFLYPNADKSKINYRLNDDKLNAFFMEYPEMRKEFAQNLKELAEAYSVQLTSDCGT